MGIGRGPGGNLGEKNNWMIKMENEKKEKYWIISPLIICCMLFIPTILYYWFNVSIRFAVELFILFSLSIPFSLLPLLLKRNYDGRLRGYDNHINFLSAANDELKIQTQNYALMAHNAESRATVYRQDLESTREELIKLRKKAKDNEKHI